MTSIVHGRDQAARPHGTASQAGPKPAGTTAVLDQRLQGTGGALQSRSCSLWSSQELLSRSGGAVLADTEPGAGVAAVGGAGEPWP
ncbi:hypothetical protein M2163_009112 [Streptomyces sp. SAI-135]|nr:hypothetical protein [Streptomyces sp. SAI-090]MDH6622004.1 hypothetical protein [Streptomyces sp. SAI-135]